MRDLMVKFLQVKTRFLGTVKLRVGSEGLLLLLLFFFSQCSTIYCRLRNFENRILRACCDSMFDNSSGNWRRKFNKEIQGEVGMAPIAVFINGQTLIMTQTRNINTNKEVIPILKTRREKREIMVLHSSKVFVL